MVVDARDRTQAEWIRRGFETDGIRTAIHVLDREGRPEVPELAGLSAYREFENDFRTKVPGRLDFVPSRERGKVMPAGLRPGILHPKARTILALVILGVFFARRRLVRWGWRRRWRESSPL